MNESRKWVAHCEGPPTDGQKETQPINRIGHPLSDGPLPFRTILDVGLVSYDEFACSLSTLSWMQATGIPQDAELQVVEQCVGGHNVIVKAWRKQ